MRRPPALEAQSALFIDVDGTLLDIAPRPELVRVPPELPQLLARLADAREEALRLIAGKMVVELHPRHHGKDAAIAAFLAESPFRGRLPVFLGDDTTDEDGFAEVNRRDGVSIRVGPTIAATAARYTLPSVAATL